MRDVAVKKFVKHVVCIFLKHTHCWQITDVGHWMAPLHAARTGHCRHLPVLAYRVADAPSGSAPASSDALS